MKPYTSSRPLWKAERVSLASLCRVSCSSVRYDLFSAWQQGQREYCNQYHSTQLVLGSRSVQVQHSKKLLEREHAIERIEFEQHNLLGGSHNNRE